MDEREIGEAVRAHPNYTDHDAMITEEVERYAHMNAMVAGYRIAKALHKKEEIICVLEEQVEVLKSEVQRLAQFVLKEVPGYPRADEEHPNGMSAVDSAVAAIKAYQRDAQALWKMLDDISTVGDACKGHSLMFQMNVNRIADRRNKVYGSDGYRLYRRIPGTEGDTLPEPEPERERIDVSPEVLN